MYKSLRRFIISIINPVVRYNLQPYQTNGDTTGPRNLNWFNQSIAPKLLQLLNEQTIDICLDLGCGNCRMAHFLSKISNTVVGIDVYETPNLKNVNDYRYVFARTPLNQFFGRVNLVFALGMLGILKKNMGIKPLVRKLDEITTHNAILIFIYDSELDDLHFLQLLRTKGFSEIQIFQTTDIPTKIVVMKKN